MRAGVVPDPYFGCNSNLLRPYEFVDWSYSTAFTAPVRASGERFELTLNGVDTVFRLFINDREVGDGANMFIEHVFDVTDFVTPGAANLLRLEITSPVQYARRFKRPPYAKALLYNYEGFCGAHLYIGLCRVRKKTLFLLFHFTYSSS